MAGLLRHDATVEFPCAAPGIPRVVGLIALPAYPNRPHDDLPEAITVQGAPRRHHRAVVPVLLHHEEAAAVLAAGRDHPVTVRYPQGHGLLDDEMLSMPGEINHVTRVGRIGDELP